MIRSKVLKKTVAGALVVCVFAVVACEKHDGVDVAAPEPEPVPDVVDDGGATKGYAYLPGNPFHDAQLDRLLDRPAVSEAVGAFTARGLRVSPEKSLTIRGINADCTVWVTFIALDGGERSAIVACYGSGERSGISPVQFALNEPPNESGWRPFVGKGWYSVPEIGQTRRAPQRWEPFEWWDWGFFGNCIVERAPKVSAMCSLQCLVVPGFWNCFLVCTVAESLLVTIDCILDMYHWGGNEIEKD
jgi:hypothetical protein